MSSLKTKSSVYYHFLQMQVVLRQNSNVSHKLPVCGLKTAKLPVLLILNLSEEWNDLVSQWRRKSRSKQQLRLGSCVQ